MRLPHFRIRTLMIAVAVAGVGFWTVVSLPRAFDIGVIVVVAPTPLIGACWWGLDSKQPFKGAIVGGSVSGMIAATVAAATTAYQQVPLPLGRPIGWFFLCVFAGLLFVAGCAQGIMYGLLVGATIRHIRDRRQRVSD